MRKFFFLYLIVFIITGCVQTTGNPRQGGIFWSEPKAVARQADLKNTYVRETNITNEVKGKTTALEHGKNQKMVELDAQKKKLNTIDNQLAGMEREVQNKRASTRAKQEEKQRVQQDIERLQYEVNVLRSNQNPDVRARKQKISELNKEIELLLNIMVNL